MKLDLNKQEMGYVMLGLLKIKEGLMENMAADGIDKESYRYFENRLTECNTMIHKVKASYKRSKK